MKRQFSEEEPELMDLPQPVTPELEKDLANLEGLNRYFGGHSILRRFLSLWLRPGRTYRALDLCTGAGDSPRLMQDYAAAQGISLTVDAVDCHPSTLKIAENRSAQYGHIRWIQADALTFDPGHTYDLVCCSLALHHFTEEKAAALLAHCARLSHRYVLVSDLERSWTTTAGVWLATELIYRDPMTKYDGRLSTRRAFSYREMGGLAKQAGWDGFRQGRFLPCRQAIWLVKEELEGAMVGLAEPVPAPCPS